MSIGLPAAVFPEQAGQGAVAEAGAREERERSLPSKLMTYRAMASRLGPPSADVAVDYFRRRTLHAGQDA
ncbi:transposase domain-containing protein [Streptomyces laculatispora]|uniref:Transposase domain-containing protein n=1 Tax=Streptomyces laculatispora TaxID=887464 RepID=A0ABY9IA39_9ACTN|nr:transposase domain-containing protein [Streptomyces laculatispora]WLQ43747.1 transposase domain-containing protein [Streptomyces laculatispora]